MRKPTPQLIGTLTQYYCSMRQRCGRKQTLALEFASTCKTRHESATTLYSGWTVIAKARTFATKFLTTPSGFYSRFVCSKASDQTHRHATTAYHPSCRLS